MLRQGVKSGGFWLALSVVAALPARADTMTGALINAYQNNPQLNSQRAVVRQTDESVRQALSGYKPTVTATLQTAQQYTSQVAKVLVPANPVDGVPAHPDYPRVGFGSSPSTIGATVTQNVFNGFQTANRVRQA